MKRPVLKQLALSLGLLLVTMLLLAGILAALGEVTINAPNGNDLGLFSSGLAGLPSYHNPLFSLLEMTEYPALVILPLILALLGRRIGAQTLPWLFVLMSLPLSIAFMRTFSQPVTDTDVSSLATQFTMLQIIPAGVLIIGYVILALYNFHSSGRKFIHKKRKLLT